MHRYRGHLPTLDRVDADTFEQRDHRLRKLVLDVLAEHRDAPGRAVDVLRRVLIAEEREYFIRDDPGRMLPRQRVPDPLRSSTKGDPR
jgi:hypothetical protein